MRIAGTFVSSASLFPVESEHTVNCMLKLESPQVPNGEGSRKVLLLTDGLANVGVTDPGSLVQMTRRQAEESNVGTTTIGFGEDFDEDLLIAMADAGRGDAHYAPTPHAAPAILAAEFEGLLSLVAQNVSVEIAMSEDVAFLGILNEFPAVAVPGGIQVSLGDVRDPQIASTVGQAAADESLLDLRERKLVVPETKAGHLGVDGVGVLP